MLVIRDIIKALQAMRQPGGLKAMLSWSCFSATSFCMNAAVAKCQPTFNTILDVGANKGQFALSAAYHFPMARIYSFEPLPDTFKKLRRNVKGKTQIRVYNCMLGSTNGKMIFFRNEYTHVSSALSIHKDNKHPKYDPKKVTAIEVDISCLDDMAAELDIKAPVLLKMDVQGYEKEVLIGAREVIRMVDYVVFESSFVHLYENQPLFDEMHSVVKNLGYELVAPVGFQEGKDLEIIEMDVLYKRSKQ